MSERAERKGLVAAQFEALQFFRGAGGALMSADDRAQYEQMRACVDVAEARLRAALETD
ncbi:hypothetical protein [Planctomonas deserti]|uniref:hypothetical protein n=1 Tax=Planctomonas deserti TaxID=2144185 RepID=UPI00131EDD25|nr:hypothetical protein [Planctomonas deserti]